MIKLKHEKRTIQEAFDDYLDYCKVKNRAIDTIAFYKNTIHRYSLYWDLSHDVCSIDKKNMDGYTLFLREQDTPPLTETTIHTYVRGMKTIVRYFMQEGFIDEFEITMPQKGETLKETYTESEIRKILKKPNLKKCTFAQYRNWAIANYLLGTGQRLNTVINLKIEDVDINEKVVRLKTTKGKRQTELPLSTTVCKVLREYLKQRAGEKGDYLFCTVKDTKMTRSAIISAIKAHNNSCGVERTSIHIFRHTFAKTYLMNGGDVFRLQRLMCHRDISTTKEYLNFQVSDLKVGFDDYNPLDLMTEKRIRMN